MIRRYVYISVTVPTVDRGFRLVDCCCPMPMDGDRPLIDSILGLLMKLVVMPFSSMYCRWLSRCMMSNTNVDFPEPEGPVITTNCCLGIAKDTFFKLFSEAPLI